MKKIILLSCCVVLLSACQITKKNTAEPIKQALQTNVNQKQVEDLVLPDDINAELYSDLSQQLVEEPKQEKRFDISARDVDASVFFSSLINDSTYSVAVSPEVTGNISLSLKQVTLTEALAVIEDMYGYEIKLQNRVYHIYPAGLRVASFTLDYLFMNRMGGSRTSASSSSLTDDDDDDDDSSSSSSSSSSTTDAEFSGSYSTNGLEDGADIVTVTSTNYWAYLETKIKTLLKGKEGQDVIISPMSGVVTLRAYPKYIREVKAFLNKETENLNRQVLLEMQIVEVELTDEYQQGIDWDSAFSSVSDFADSTIQGAIGGGGALTISSGSFSSVINLLATKGDVNVLSKPRITAINNQKAVIKVGGDEYFVTDASITTDTDDDGDTTVTPDFDFDSFFSGVSVDVTPKINDDNSVLLHIHPIIVDVDEDEMTLSYGSNTDTNEMVLPFAKSDVQEFDTIVKANSGEMVVIGGLMKTNEEDKVSTTPFLSAIPFIGELFTNRYKVNNKSELIILVKPQVVTKNTWKMEIQKSSDLIDKWYPSK